MKLLSLVIATAAVSLGDTVADHNAHAWVMYFGDHPVRGRWGMHVEGQWRRAEVGRTWQQLLLRPGLNYQLKRNLLLTVGYGYIRSHPYGDFPANAVVPEHRTYGQALWSHRLQKIPLQHRFRLEQRWVGQGEGWQYRNRFRYMLRADFPIRGPVYLGVYDEAFYGFGRHRGPRALDQNRAYAAVGYNLGLPGRVEFGYLHQYVPQRTGIVREHNHTLQVAFFSKLPFGGSN
jgi:hypothetical protein